MKSFALVAILALSAAVLAPSTRVEAAPGIAIPMSGSGPGSTFTGTFNLERFVAANTESGVAAVGRLTGTLKKGAQTVSIVQTITLPVGGINTTCDILHLDLGPLNLDLLGLQIDLSRIVLDITAQAAPGNLLGNLLCAVAGLLDNPSGLAALLNQILGILLA